MNRCWWLAVTLALSVAMVDAEGPTADSPDHVDLNPLTALVFATINQKDFGLSSPNFFLGSLSLGFAEPKRESLVGFSWFPGFVDLNLQNRTFYNSDNQGFFTGILYSLEWVRFQTALNSAGMVGFSTGDGIPVSLVGGRIGGHFGFRWRWGLVGFSTRLGLVFPMFYLLNLPYHQQSQIVQAYTLAAVTRMIDMGLTVDFFFGR